MKFCSKCGTQCEDFAVVCTNCGNPFSKASTPAPAPVPTPVGAGAPASEPVAQAAPAPAPQPMPAPQPAMASYTADPKDHTNEFDPKDISDNKVIAMLPYLLGPIGLIIAILMAGTSKYVQFHVRTALKFTVVETILVFANIIPFLGWLAYAVCTTICLVLRIIAFFQICSGKAKEPAIISNLGFLK